MMTMMMTTTMIMMIILPTTNERSYRTATATVSMRIVPDQDLEEVCTAFERHMISEFRKLASSNRCKIKIGHRSDWWLANVEKCKLYQAASDAIQAEWNVKPLLIREGGECRECGGEGGGWGGERSVPHIHHFIHIIHIIITIIARLHPCHSVFGKVLLCLRRAHPDGPGRSFGADMVGGLIGRLEFCCLLFVFLCVNMDIGQ